MFCTMHLLLCVRADLLPEWETHLEVTQPAIDSSQTYIHSRIGLTLIYTGAPAGAITVYQVKRAENKL